MPNIPNALLKSKFRGCLLGSLIGSCVGLPFCGESTNAAYRQSLNHILNHIETMSPILQTEKRTDGTNMTQSVMESLAKTPNIDYEHIAKEMVKKYFSEPSRKYSETIVKTFYQLKYADSQDISKPARERFGGMGSFGSGGAIRVAPIILYFYNNYDSMIEAVKTVTKITHSHVLGVNGALLQGLAIYQSLYLNPAANLNVTSFISQLMKRMETIEENDKFKSYQEKLKVVSDLLKKTRTADLENEINEVNETLGNSMEALRSVPTAIYCFLRAQKAIPEIETENPYRRTIQFALALGGMTDVIASMAGAISGAQLGEESIVKSLRKRCDFDNGVTKLTDILYSHAVKRKKK